jgi:hypothetical protein
MAAVCLWNAMSEEILPFACLENERQREETAEGREKGF